MISQFMKELATYLLILMFFLSVLYMTATSYAADSLQGHLDQTFEEFFNHDEGGLPGGVVYITHRGVPVYERVFGLANVEQGTPISLETNFRLASITKQFTAFCVLQLADRGALSLDDTIDKFFPELPKIAQKVTVRHLLTHTSGIIDYEDLIPDDVTDQLHDIDVLNLVATQHGLYTPPGAAYNYSNSGYALLALIVERVSGISYAEYLEENIFQPLGMDTSVAYQKGISEVENRAMGYRLVEGEYQFRDQSRTSAILGDGGIYGNVLEYALWEESLATTQLLSQELLDDSMTRFELENGDEIDYGYGWRIFDIQGVRVVGHGGSTSGFNNFVYRAPDRDLLFIILTNRAGNSCYDLAGEVMKWLLEQDLGAASE
jgi:CubicO group peptidase (beta-lactamase class C family)